MSEPIETTLTIDTRLYDLIRQVSITNIDEALVELVTNSVDAYNTRTDWTTKTIDIEVNEESRVLTIRDYSIGMSNAEICAKVLVVGSLTAVDTSRGFIGRGLKDVSSIGDITLVSIKNGLLTRVIIKENMSVLIYEQDVEASVDHQILYKLPSDGTSVSVNVNKTVIFQDSFKVYTNVCNNIFFRKIHEDGSFNITVNGTKTTYTYPAAKRILNYDFDINGYEGAKGNFKLYKTDTPIKSKYNSMFNSHGVLVTTSKSVYENGSCIASSDLYARDYTTNNNFRYIYGELKCDYIDKLVQDITTTGRTTDNPHLVFDPNRRGGLSKKHPFVIKLFEYPYKWIEMVVNKIGDDIDTGIDTNNEIKGLFNTISDYLSSTLKPEKLLYTYRTKRETENLASMIARVDLLDYDSDAIGVPKTLIDSIASNGELVPHAVSNDTSTRYEFMLVNNIESKNPYEIYFYPSKILTKINARYPSIEPFIDVDDIDNNGIIDIKTEGAYAALGSIMVNVIEDIKTRSIVMDSNIETTITTDGLNELNSIRSEVHDMLYIPTKSMFNTIKTTILNK